MTSTAESASLLIIDDDPVLRLMMSDVLENVGYRVFQADSAEAGLRRFDSEKIDLILLDVMLPGISGFEACAWIRANPRGATLPIIVMTGRDDHQAIVEAYDSGATDFITKPTNWALLPYRVRYALRGSVALSEATRSRALLARSQRLANMGSWEWSRDDGRLEMSEELARIHGRSAPRSDAPLERLLDMVHEEDRPGLATALRRARTFGEPYSTQFRMVRPNGVVRRLFEQTDVERAHDGSVIAMRGIRIDITEQADADSRIRTLADYDALTGLPNRSLFRQVAAARLAQLQPLGRRCAILFIGMTDFPRINEQLGPAIADGLLLAVSDRLRRCIKSTPSGVDEAVHDLLARFGGGEFLLLLADAADANTALRRAEQILRVLDAPLPSAAGQLAVGARVGVAMSTPDGGDIDNMLNQAGTAAHAAKEPGSVPVRFYDDAMSAELKRRNTIQAELRSAINADELRLHYQAKVDTRTSTINGAEALLRWQHPQRGLIGPNEFIDIAEECGLIVEITEWAIAAVARQQALWRDAGIAIVPVAVNLAAASLRSSAIVDCVARALQRHALEASALELEVTESSLMIDMDGACAVLLQLKALGLRLSIDDFGVGYSSLSYLKRFPFDVLKIDRGFIGNMVPDSNDAKLTSAIIAMGLSMDLDLIAEGVETREQVAFLTARGCHVVQGFLYAKALDVDAFAALLAENSPRQLAVS